jgi:hypothetical protein
LSDYINAYLRVWCTSLLFTRSVYQPPYSVHQPPAYAAGAPLKHWLIRGEDASVYRPRSLLQYKNKSPSTQAYDTICISCPGIRLTCTIKLVQTLLIYITCSSAFINLSLALRSHQPYKLPHKLPYKLPHELPHKLSALWAVCLIGSLPYKLSAL